MEAEIKLGELNICVNCGKLRHTYSIDEDKLPICQSCTAPKAANHHVAQLRQTYANLDATRAGYEQRAAECHDGEAQAYHKLAGTLTAQMEELRAEIEAAQ